MTEGGDYSPAMMSEDPFKSMKKIKKNSHSNNQRRFTDKQIKSLEMMFEAEARLEPRKKVQLARELGLQPRQVAIWFQNKRARWKSKQLETEYNILRQNYNNLVSQFESLKKEKQALVSELERLNEAMQKTQEEERQCCGEKEENQRGEPEMHEKGYHGVLYDDDDGCNNNIKREYFGGFEEEADHLMDIVESADSCLTSSDGWESFKLDQTSSNYPWLDLWS